VAAPANGTNNEYPTVVVDAAGNSHILYNRYVPATAQIDLFMVSGSKTGFGSPQNLTRTDDVGELAARAVIAADGVMHVVCLERVPIPDHPDNYTYSVGYFQIRGGVVSARERIAEVASVFSGDPEQSIAVDDSGRPHVVFRVPNPDPSKGRLFYRHRQSSELPGTVPVDNAWTTALPLTGDTEDATGASIGVDAAGKVHFSYAIGISQRTLHYRMLDTGVLGPDTHLTTATTDRAYYLGLAVEPTGVVHIGFRRLAGMFADVYYLQGFDGVFAVEEQVSQTATGDELGPAIAAGPRVALVYTENMSPAPEGKVFFAERTLLPR
jgi:hypothetical protein